ncbi:hypothetical protein PROFUN_03548 [Planoprotostelium fungivorum]|uniref:Rho-GAP domain-containing protein n=1 Tax=Planoprotostelium fungivorum TaxID=1890364 RepID=A0A2P6MSF6_9EUKA|nr:hypothetical protein PROFUN_03548 [Planoprotostelium fungivorum]
MESLMWASTTHKRLVHRIKTSSPSAEAPAISMESKTMRHHKTTSLVTDASEKKHHHFGHRRKKSTNDANIHASKEGHTVPLVKFWKAKRGFDRNVDVIPPIVNETVEWLYKYALRTEGLFRLSGSVVDVKKLKKKYDKGKSPELPSDMDPHIVSGLLKQFFIEPPESILTDELYEAFLQSVEIEDEQARTDCVIEVLGQLPPANKAILSRLFRLLYTIQLHSDENKMTASNLSICFAPTLVRKQHMEMLKVLSNSEVTKCLVQFIIEKYHAVFENRPRAAAIDGDKKMTEFKKALLKGTVRLARNKMKELGQYEDIQDISKETSMQEDQIGMEELQSAHEKRPVQEIAVALWGEDFFAPPDATPSSAMGQRAAERLLATRSLKMSPQREKRNLLNLADLPSKDANTRLRRLSLTPQMMLSRDDIVDPLTQVVVTPPPAELVKEALLADLDTQSEELPADKNTLSPERTARLGHHRTPSSETAAQIENELATQLLRSLERGQDEDTGPAIQNLAAEFAEKVRTIRGSKGTVRAGSFAVAMKLFDVFDAHVSGEYSMGDFGETDETTPAATEGDNVSQT